MIRDPFYRQIIDRLSKTVDPDLFEQCAAEILREIYPSLVPVSGGGDAGRDGAIADGIGEPYPLVSTTGNDVIGNLTKNLESYSKEGGSRRKVVLATSQDLSPKRKLNLHKRANEFGFTLIQIHDQESIANLLYHDSKWCLELLGLTGDLRALSANPKSIRPILNGSLVGRDSDLTWLKAIPSDSVLVAQPGSGKTFLMLNLLEQGALFVVSPNRTEIANGVRDDEPTILMLDDAGTNLELLTDLVQIRQEIGGEFLILASCWPRDRASVTSVLNLSESSVRALELLTRNEIVEVIKDAGLFGSNALVREIVNQSEGRPGLAATLANLALRGDVEEVALGEALSDSIKSVSEIIAGTRTDEVLAAFSVGGKSGMSMESVANDLAIDLVTVRRILTDLAHAGIVYEVNSELLSVRPAALRFILVRDVFFNGPTSLPIGSLVSHAPNVSEVVRTIIGAKARGARVQESLLIDLLRQCGDAETWAIYASLGKQETEWILRHYPEKACSIAEPALEHSPEVVIPMLLQSAVGDQRPQNSYPEHPLRMLKDWADSAYPGTGEGIGRREAIFESTKLWLETGQSQPIGLSALESALSPSVEFHTTDPGLGDTITIHQGHLSQHELVELDDMWTRALDVITPLEIEDWKPIQTVIENWAYPGRAAPASSEIEEVMRNTAKKMLQDIVGLAANRPGVLLWVKQIGERIGEPFDDIQVNAEFEILHPQGYMADFKLSEAKCIAAVIVLAEKWSNLKEADVAELISGIEQEALSTGHTWPNYTPQVCYEIAQRVEYPLAWAEAFFRTDAESDSIVPFLKQSAKLQEPDWIQFAEKCLAVPKLRFGIIAMVITNENTPVNLLDKTLNNVKDAGHLINTYCMRNEVNDGVLIRLLSHESEEITTAAALGVWQADPYAQIPENLSDQWLVAFNNSCSNDYWIGEVIKSDNSLAFDWLERRIAEMPRALYKLHHAVDAAIAGLSFEEGKTILHSFPIEYSFTPMVTRIVDGNIDRYRDLLGDKKLKDFHLRPLAGDPEGQWIEMALVALEFGYSPNDIAMSAIHPPMHFSGKESAMWAAWSEKFGQLLLHENPNIQAVGQLGSAMTTSYEETAIEREHDLDVHGFPGSNLV